jgi:hypothetical protein
MLHDFFVGSCPSPLPLEQSWGMLDEALGGASASSSPATKWLGAWWYVVFCFPHPLEQIWGKNLVFVWLPPPPTPGSKLRGMPADVCPCLLVRPGTFNFELGRGGRGKGHWRNCRLTYSINSIGAYLHVYIYIPHAPFLMPPFHLVPHAPIVYARPSCPHYIPQSLMPQIAMTFFKKCFGKRVHTL